MKVFDGHADIFYDITRRALEGESDILRKHHWKRLKKGQVMGGIYISWTPERDFNRNPISDPQKYFDFMMETVEKELSLSESFIKIMKSKSDLDSIFQEDKLYIIKGLEGIRVVDDELELLDKVYQLGYRHISLTWNEENKLATGVRGDSERGVTELGKKALEKAEALGMIIDVSHLNEKSFWDTLENTKTPIIASHSNAYSLCNQKRNLTDEQIKAIGFREGVIGINAYREFISDKEEERNIERLADHLDYMVDLIGAEQVGFGFDFCEYLYANCGKMNPDGMDDASYVPKFLEILRRRGYSEDELEGFAYKNFINLFRKILK